MSVDCCIYHVKEQYIIFRDNRSDFVRLFRKAVVYILHIQGKVHLEFKYHPCATHYYVDGGSGYIF